MNLRIKQIRKQLKKTQKEFGESLGVSRDTFASYESGRVEPNKTFVRLLCTTYNVNEEWLRTGQGEMFVETKKAFLDKLEKEMNLNLTVRNIIEIYLNMGEEQKLIVDALFKTLEETSKNNIENPVDEAIKKTDRIFRAAKSDDNAAPEILDVSADRIKKLEEADEADEI